MNSLNGGSMETMQRPDVIPGNIEEIDEQGEAIARLCCSPRGDIPHHDALLGQLLALQHDEDAFRRAANITPLRRVA